MTDKKNVVVFGVECVDRYGNGRFSGQLRSGDEIAWQVGRNDGHTNIVSLWFGTIPVASASSDSVEGAQDALVERVRDVIAAGQRFLDQFGGES